MIYRPVRVFWVYTWIGVKSIQVSHINFPSPVTAKIR
jgi:hypothetical protein